MNTANLHAPVVEERDIDTEREIRRARSEFLTWANHLDGLIRRYGVREAEKNALSEAARNILRRLEMAREV